MLKINLLLSWRGLPFPDPLCYSHQLMSKRHVAMRDRVHAVVSICFTATSSGQSHRDLDIRRIGVKLRAKAELQSQG